MSRRSKTSFLKNSKKIKLGNSTRAFLVVLSLFVFAISSASFYDSIFNNDKTTTEEKVYIYKNEYESDYTVNLKHNPFISESSLPAGETYISELIDSIDMNIKYDYSGSEDCIVKYSYKIDAVIGANYSYNGQNYSIWNKVDNLKTVNNMQSYSSIVIKDNVNVNYEKYNQEVKTFKQSLGMNVDAFLYIRLTVDTSATLEKQEIPNQYVSDFSISLGDKIAIIDEENPDVSIDSVVEENTITESSIDIFRLLISLVAIVYSLYIIYYIKFKTKKFNHIKNEFKLELNRILKSCQDRIVFVKNKLERADERVVDVNDFGELIKLSEELYKPILCWISDDLNDEQAWFSIIGNRTRYRFILKK